MSCVPTYTATFGIENDCIFTTQFIYVFHVIVTINHFFRCKINWPVIEGVPVCLQCEVQFM